MLDVDGPLNPNMARPTKRPPGYQTYRYVHRTDQLVGGPEARKTKGVRVWLNPAHGPQLLALAAETGLTMVWATTWEHQANRLVAPAIGLPRLPVILFNEPMPNWKWDAVATYADGQPIAWFDDNHHKAGRAEFEAHRAGLPTLLCHVDPTTGLLPTHFDQVREFALAAGDQEPFNCP